jgi:hypothetical protein
LLEGAIAMGREAVCLCNWGGQSADAKVLLETHELIVRGAIRRLVPIASLTDVAVHEGQLHFRSGEDDVALTLGQELAQSWARKIATPPPTLAVKLGIHGQSKVLVLGESESEELDAALAAAGTQTSKAPELIIIHAGTQIELDNALKRATAYVASPAIWIVYRKGPRSELSEADIRNTLRGQGFMDTKVASVSATHTALRFNRRA